MPFEVGGYGGRWLRLGQKVSEQLWLLSTCALGNVHQEWWTSSSCRRTSVWHGWSLPNLKLCEKNSLCKVVTNTITGKSKKSSLTQTPPAHVALKQHVKDLKNGGRPTLEPLKCGCVSLHMCGSGALKAQAQGISITRPSCLPCPLTWLLSPANFALPKSQPPL